ncbi:hypothetical protein COU37_03720 [Candidatus Micrarchaeota archaeon CG10_big_fil_rev_8_21_14_0_10_45_29]|nr:MAG: hypothetical protein COU37_03720 [Candidatus Micrarchaeota archaeon CG10_big_fil_rev_8_21_14_0_10_45_29]
MASILQNIKKLDRYGWKVLFSPILAPIILGAIIFYFAGTDKLPRVWDYLISTFVILGACTVWLLKENPKLLNERGNWAKHGDKTKIDTVIFFLFGIFSYYLMAALAGYEYAQTGALSAWADFEVLAIIVYALGTAGTYWAMVENKFFEVRVRMQKEKKQYVCKSGPYAFVRHPGYAFVIPSLLAMPVIIGSLWGLYAEIIAIFFMLVRTVREDKMLFENLNGYKKYSKKVKWRLIPGIW